MERYLIKNALLFSLACKEQYIIGSVAVYFAYVSPLLEFIVQACSGNTRERSLAKQQLHCYSRII